MAPCTCCDLAAEIVTVLEADSPARIRHLCAIIYPSLSWREAQVHAAADIRHHCHFLAQERLITQVDEDTFVVTPCASA